RSELLLQRRILPVGAEPATYWLRSWLKTSQKAVGMPGFSTGAVFPAKQLPLMTVSVAGVPGPLSLDRVTDRVMVPSPRPLRSIPETAWEAEETVPLP